MVQRCRSTTTRCWPRSSRTPRPAGSQRWCSPTRLARSRLHGVRTNRELLVNVLRHPAFLDGATDTAFFDTHGLAELSAPLADDATTSGCRRSPRRLPTPRTIARRPRRRPRLDSQRLAQPGVRATRSRPTSTTHGMRAPQSNTVSPEPDWCCRRRIGAVWSRRRPDEVVLADGNGVACSFAVARYDPGCLRRLGARTGAPGRAAALPRAGFGRREGFAGSAHARQRHPARRHGRRYRHGRSAADLAGGNEDGAHHHRTGRRRARRTQRRVPATKSKSAPSWHGSKRPKMPEPKGDPE